MEKHKKNQSKVCFRFQCLHCDKKLSTMVGFTKHNQTVHDVTVEPVEIIEELVDINNQPIGTIFPDFENIQIWTTDNTVRWKSYYCDHFQIKRVVSVDVFMGAGEGSHDLDTSWPSIMFKRELCLAEEVGKA